MFFCRRTGRFFLLALLFGPAALAIGGVLSASKEEMAQRYVATLRAHPDDSTAREGLRRLFTEAYPTRLPAEVLSFLPIPYHECRDTILVGRPTQRAFYTTGLAFPDANHRRDPRQRQTFTRALYAYVQEREGGEWQLAFRVLSNHSDAGSQELAPAAVRSLLRVRAAHLALIGELPPVLRQPVDVWICAKGDGGAEQSGPHLYLLGTAEPRSPLELLRQMAHEFGHLALPPVGPLQAPERWGNGFLGEVLYLRWLSCAPEAADFLVSQADLAAYVRHEVDPLERAFAAVGFGAFAGQEESAGGLHLLLGMVLHLETTRGANAVSHLVRTVPGSTLQEWMATARPLLVEAQPPDATPAVE